MSLLLRLSPGRKDVPKCPTVDKYAVTHPDWAGRTLTELLDHLAAGRLAPIIAERVPLAEAARAHESLERRGHTGKFVLTTEADHEHPQ